MNKKNKIIIVVVLILIASGIAVLFSLLKSKDNNSKIDYTLSELPNDDLRKYSNTDKLKIKGKFGLVSVSNFLEKAQEIDKEQSLIFMDSDVSITYNLNESIFYLAVDSLDVKKDVASIEKGENYLLNILGVDKDILCSLNVVEIQITSLNEPIQAKQSSPNFCSNVESFNNDTQKEINLR